MLLKEFNARGLIRKKLKNNRVIYEITELGEKKLVEGLKLFIETKFNINEENEVRDCVLITDISGIGDEAFVEIRNNYVYKIGKDIH